MHLYERIHLEIESYNPESGLVTGKVTQFFTKEQGADDWKEPDAEMPVHFEVDTKAEPPICTSEPTRPLGWKPWVASIVYKRVAQVGSGIVGERLSEIRDRFPPSYREAQVSIVFGGVRAFPQDDGFKVGEWVDLANKDDTGVTCWLWRIVKLPSGSQAKVNDPRAAHPGRVLLDVPGEYVFELMVNDGHGLRRARRTLVAEVERPGTRPWQHRALRQIAGIVGPGDIYSCEDDEDPIVGRVRREIRDMRAQIGKLEANYAEAGAIIRKAREALGVPAGTFCDDLVPAIQKALDRARQEGREASEAVAEMYFAKQVEAVSKLVWDDRKQAREGTLVDRVKEVLALWDNAREASWTVRGRLEAARAELRHAQNTVATRERQGRELVEMLKAYIPPKLTEPEVFAGVRGALARIAELEARPTGHMPDKLRESFGNLAEWITRELAENIDARTAEILSWKHGACETAVHLLQLALDRGAFVKAEHVVQAAVETAESMSLYGRLCEAIGVPPGANPVTRGREMRDKRFRLSEAVRRVPQAAAVYRELVDQKWLPPAIAEADKLDDEALTRAARHEVKFDPGQVTYNAPEQVIGAIQTPIADKLAESGISKADLVRLLRKAQAERDELAAENVKLDSALTLANLRGPLSTPKCPALVVPDLPGVDPGYIKAARVTLHVELEDLAAGSMLVQHFGPTVTYDMPVVGSERGSEGKLTHLLGTPSIVGVDQAKPGTDRTVKAEYSAASGKWRVSEVAVQTRVPPFVCMDRAAALWDLLAKIEHTGPWGGEHAERYHQQVTEIARQRRLYLDESGSGRDLVTTGEFGHGPIGRMTRIEQGIAEAASQVYDAGPAPVDKPGASETAARASLAELGVTDPSTSLLRAQLALDHTKDAHDLIAYLRDRSVKATLDVAEEGARTLRNSLLARERKT